MRQVSPNVVVLEGRSAMRAQITTRLSHQLCVPCLIALLIGSSFAQEPPEHSEKQRADDMRDDMLRRMGPYTPRELYPSLMRLPELSPEKRAEITRLARQRMEDGLQTLTESRAALTAATEHNDLRRMEQAAAQMRAGVAQYQSGLAAFRALEDGEGTREIALSWFRREMNLDSSAEAEPDAIVFGMTLFHTTLCVLLVLFGSAMVWMYFLRMRRAAALLRRLSQPPAPTDADA